MELMDAIATFVSFILAFAVILGLAYITTKIVASASFKKYKNKNMRLLEGLSIGPQKSLELIKVGKKIILLGVSKDNITKIETFNEDELEVNEEKYDKSLFTLEDLFARGNKSFNNEKDFIGRKRKSKYKSKEHSNSLLKRAILNIKDEPKKGEALNLDSLNHHLYDDTRRYNDDYIQTEIDYDDDDEFDNEFNSEENVTNGFDKYFKDALESELRNEMAHDEDNVRTNHVGYDKNGDFQTVLMKLNKK